MTRRLRIVGLIFSLTATAMAGCLFTLKAQDGGRSIDVQIQPATSTADAS